MRRIIVVAVVLALVITGIAFLGPFSSGGSSSTPTSVPRQLYKEARADANAARADSGEISLSEAAQFKEVFLESIEDNYRESGAPTTFSECMVTEIDQRFEADDMQKILAGLPQPITASPAALKAVSRGTNSAVEESGEICGRRMVTSGEYTSSEAVRILDRIAGE